MKARESDYSKEYPDVPYHIRLSDHEIPTQQMHHGKSVVEDRNEEIFARVQGGETVASVARGMGLNPSTVTAYMHRKGILLGRHKPSVVAPYHDQVLAWVKAGLSSVAISKKIGIHKSTVNGYIVRNHMRDKI